MAEKKFVKEDFDIAYDKNLGAARVSINIVTEDSPPTIPKHNADVIFAWCYSFMYCHEVESSCFPLK